MLAQPHSISAGTVLVRGEQYDNPCALSEDEAKGVVCKTRAPTAVDAINTYSLTDLEGEPIRL